MSIVGKVDSLWRYPVKSMRGEQLNEAFVGFAGVFGDRQFAIRSAASPKGFPYLTAREQRALLQYRPRFRHADKAARPSNLAEAESLAPGLTPVSADPHDLMVDVEVPTGEKLSIDDPALLRRLRDTVPGTPDLTLVRSDRSMTDCRPVSLLSVQTVRQLGEELGAPVDQRRFRANIYLDLQHQVRRVCRYRSQTGRDALRFGQIGGPRCFVRITEARAVAQQFALLAGGQVGESLGTR